MTINLIYIAMICLFPVLLVCSAKIIVKAQDREKVVRDKQKEGVSVKESEIRSIKASFYTGAGLIFSWLVLYLMVLPVDRPNNLTVIEPVNICVNRTVFLYRENPNHAALNKPMECKARIKSGTEIQKTGETTPFYNWSEIVYDGEVWYVRTKALERCGEQIFE